MKRVGLNRLENTPWLWSLLASFLMWIVIGVLSKQFSLQTLMINATLATFLAIVGLGQMFVITGGDGGIDLSIPYVMTLTAFLSEGIMNGSNANLLKGILISLVAGLAVGFANSILVVLLKIPSIVATLAMGYIVDTAGLVYAHGFSSGQASPLLQHFVKANFLGVPWMVIATIIVAIIIGVVLNHTPYGRRLLAMGQNKRAAQLAGIRTKRVQSISFLLSGVLAALGGVMLSVYVGGAFLNMGSPYLLESIGAVVIGGTFVSGGKSTVTGTLGGALFLTLVVTLMEVTKLAIGLQYVVEGALVILVLLVANRRTAGA
ncbi:ABC transporter permease [Alicyclobacillus fastidiosus]|uniref:ABC transporter permease n=1 Tax=Alicyclobacillus fastidiosus TaxID=392011 RepID=A0ABY6ZAK2_9BACL|nr:ABC transporter permease [Alicyclobacillus fastidiosus]WAH39849.1 ABC transporter permease [Alicyclobacillus fastidiosus]GMA61107.1 ABC transporter permease [Alicyclobacillus fastidiosus]